MLMRNWLVAHAKRYYLSILIILFLFHSNIYTQSEEKSGTYKGTIKGKVVDETTQSPLPAVNVLIVGTEMGAAADYDGNFVIENVPAGSYNLQIRMMGYEDRIVSNVVVNPLRKTYLKIELKPTVLEGEGVVVTAGYFHEAKDAVVSNRSMDFEEIRSDPGSAEDVQRVVQALPSVVSGSDQQNEIIVRGGMPGENLFVMDNIEIPNPNHFGYQGTGGGPMNMVNPYMIRRVDFYAGAFPVRYGDKASSVMDISLREGNREEYDGHLNLGMAGAGAMAEGPIGGGKGAWILSARKSFLDLIISSTGLTAVPKYYSLQGKATYDLNTKNKLIINGIYGDDKIHIEDEEEEGDSGYERGAENVRSLSHQYAFGGTLQSLFGDLGMSELTLYQTLNHWDQYVYDNNDDPYYTNISTEIERAVKYDITLLPTRKVELDFGLALKGLTFNHDQWSDPDTLFIYDVEADPDTILGIKQTYPEWIAKQKEDTYKLALYGQTKIYPIPRLEITAGIRLDYMHYIREKAIDPRLGLSYNLNKKTSLNLAIGQQSQSPAYVQLTAHPDNSNLEYKRTRQVVFGIERLFREDMRGTVELFYKDYRNIPLAYSWTTPDPFDRSEGKLVNEGKGYARGVEVFVQKKMMNNYFFTLSYAYSIAKGFDPRFDEYFNWDYDYRHIFTFINGYRFDFRKYDWYAKLKANTLYNIFAWMLPFADQMDFSIRWRYLGGRPYTKPVYYANLNRWVTDETVLQNIHRYPSYHRLDLRIDRRFMFKGWNIVTYFDLMNVYGRDNIWSYSYQDDGTVDEILQWKVFPVGGLAIEF